jgi:GTPase SAR1 family protein
MGCNSSRDDPASQQSRRLDAQIRTEARAHGQDTKMLLLGPGESGKSTLFKQMKILAREGGYSETELSKYKSNIYTNCISQMRIICEQGDGIELSDKLRKLADMIMSTPASGDNWTVEICDTIQTLWAAEEIQTLYERCKAQLNESSVYFFENLERFRDPDNYTPTAADVLRARVRSTGIEEAEFKFDELRFRMFDVGGQRSERRKWIHCFDSVTVVIFCASLSEYDQVLREDASTNRMQESLLLFDEIVNSPWFRRVPVVLFLNKIDLFNEKIALVPLSVCFGNYTGKNTPDEAKEYIRQRFVDLPQDKSKNIYVHYTCAIDTRQVEVVFRVVKETLLREILQNFVV